MGKSNRHGSANPSFWSCSLQRAIRRAILSKTWLIFRPRSQPTKKAARKFCGWSSTGASKRCSLTWGMSRTMQPQRFRARLERCMTVKPASPWTMGRSFEFLSRSTPRPPRPRSISRVLPNSAPVTSTRPERSLWRRCSTFTDAWSMTTSR